MGVTAFLRRIAYWRGADRLGPDIPWTHWRLHFPDLGLELCRTKFLHFGLMAEFRPGAYAEACSRISIGRRVVIRPGTMLFADPAPGGEGITIEDDVLIGAGVHIYSANHRFDSLETPIIEQGFLPSRQVILRRGCWIGARSIILAGTEIGENSVIGAGSLVTKSIASGVVAAGNPAKVIRSVVSSHS
jgi:acetyltransferase-like isoleucine patch superfamily enzyme